MAGAELSSSAPNPRPAPLVATLKRADSVPTFCPRDRALVAGVEMIGRPTEASSVRSERTAATKTAADIVYVAS